MWLNVGAEPLYAVVHRPASDHRRDTAVLIVPTFGWDDMTSYRARREWARELAEAGFETVRIDLPGSEESVGSPLAPGRYQSWIDTVIEVTSWLRESSVCSRVAVIGIGLGGTLALQAMAARAVIDDLVVWAVPARGRTYLREVRMHSDLIAGMVGESQPGRSDGALELSGYLMSAETAAILSDTRLTDLTFPPAESRRVLMLGRDARGVDENLRRHLEGAGLEVTVHDATDHEKLTAHPTAGQVPRESIATTIGWLEEVAGTTARPSLIGADGVSDTITLEYEGRMIRERLVEYETTGGRVVGIVAEPLEGEPAGFCALAVNTGALRRGGPNRMGTEQGRHCAAWGCPAARFDLIGIGDADGQYVNLIERTEADEAQTLAVLVELCDHLRGDGVADRFLALGLCSGARWGFKLALADARVIGAFLVNLPNLRWQTPVWVPALSDVQRDPGELSMRHRIGQRLRALPASDRAWAGSVTWTCIHKTRWLGDSGYRADHRVLRAALRTVHRRDLRVELVFSLGEPVHRRLRESRLLTKLERGCPSVTVGEVPTRDHEVRPTWVRDKIIPRLDRVLDDCQRASLS